MKKTLLIAVALLYVATGFSQTKIDLADVSKHVGDSVVVEGKIFGVKTFDKEGSPVLLNLGADFPKQVLTVAVFPAYPSGAMAMPTEKESGNTARVSGKIELYKGRPQIAVRTAGQLSITPAKQ